VDAALNNRIIYYEPEDTRVDMGDSKVSLRVRVEPPNDSHSGAGLLFRASRDGSDYYVFMLNPGCNVTFAETRASKIGSCGLMKYTRLDRGDFVSLKIVGNIGKIHRR